MINQFENQEVGKPLIRIATVMDAPALARARYDFRAPLNPVSENQDRFIERCQQWMEERLRENSLWRCWVAEQGDTLVGNLWMQLIEKIPNPVVEAEYHAYITNVYVSEAVRGQGIGSSLLATAIDWVKTQDIHAVILWTTEKSRPLYARQGFAVRDDLLELITKESHES